MTKNPGEDLPQDGQNNRINDDAVLRALGGAFFQGGATRRLPSGEALDADTANAFSAAWSQDAPPIGNSETKYPDYARTDFQDKDKELIEAFRERCHLATADDYLQWLDYWLKNNGKLTDHNYDYPFSQANHGDWLVLDKHARIPSLYGDKSLQIIVPKGLQLEPLDGKNWGHNSAFMYGSRFGDPQVGGAASIWIPTFTDIRTKLVNLDPRRNSSLRTGAFTSYID